LLRFGIAVSETSRLSLRGIGGNLGLFIGISGVTIIEWLEFLVVSLCTYTCCAAGIPLCHDESEIPATDPGAEVEQEKEVGDDSKNPSSQSKATEDKPPAMGQFSLQV